LFTSNFEGVLEKIYSDESNHWLLKVEMKTCWLKQCPI
jgi:hypothetical protein